MGRILYTFLMLIFCISVCYSQCPDLPNNTTVDGSTNTSIDMCGPGSALFEVNDPNLPSGNIDWYSSTTSGFDPLTSGTLLGSSAIDSADPCDPGGCPNLEAIYINACDPGAERLNEFVVVASGSGFLVDNFSFNFDPGNIGGSVTNGNINVGGICTWIDGDASLFTGCSSVISAGLGDYIPPNSLVIVQASSFSSSSYDISGLCGLSECIYVISNSCDRVNAAFKNYEAANSTTRTNSIALNCGCADQITYTVNDPGFAPFSGDGSYVLSDGTTFGNNGCNFGPSIGSIAQYAYSAVTDDFNHNFTNAECNTTQYIVGVLNSSQYNTDCCSEQLTEEYEFNIACITAELQGDVSLCPGECAQVSVLITGGQSPYDLDLSITGLPFPFNNISLPFIGFPLDDKITICFDNGGPIVDNATFTVDAPAIVGGFSGTLVLNSITDDNGCAGTINGSTISLSFNNAPDIVNPGEQETCDIGDGTGIFILSDLDNIINNGSGETVNYFSDMAGTMPIADPFITSGATIYAQIDSDPCDSEIIEFTLTVISNGDAGLVTFFCTDDAGPSDECTICDDDGVLGENVDLTIIFENPLLNYEFEVVWTAASGPSSTIVGSGIGTATLSFSIVETTTFVISVVTADGDCPDMTDLGDVITINYSIQPDIDEPNNLSDCGSVTLPDITGNSVPANTAYFSESGGMGTMFSSGDILTSTTTLFLYGGIEGCDEEYSFEVTIEEQAMIDDPIDVITCGVYALPEITGTNIENASYYTEMDGAGLIVSEGTIISTSTILFLFDANCGGNQPTLDITITPGPIIENNTDTIVCEMYIVEPIIGIDLSGNEMYFDTTGGNGLIINVGDTLTQDSILFIYDNTGGCEIQIPVFIDIREPGYPGLDTAIVLCEGDATLININEELGGDLPDFTGMWLDVNATGLIIDSSQVDFSTLSIGSYLFEYQIQDSICIDTQSILTVNIIGTPNAGDDATLSLCSDTVGVNVLNLLGNPDVGGTFFNEANMTATFDPENASFDASVIGSTVYTYIVGNPASSCGADSSTFTVIVEGSVSAGNDVTNNACAGLVLDLTTLITNNSGIGIFEEIAPSGGLSGSTFDTEDVDDGSYTIFHILPGMGFCPADTAMLTIIVTDAPNAGDENNLILCGDTLISLMDLINGDQGGQFYFNSTLLPSGEIKYTNETGTLNYLYVVGDGVDCPLDSAELTVTRSIKPATFLDISLTALCDDDCTTVTFNAVNNGGQTINLFYHIESNMGEMENRTQDIGDLMPNVEITFCIGVGDLSNNELQPGTEYIFTLDSIAVDNPDCVYLDGASVTFNTNVDVNFDLTGTYCLDAIVDVGGDSYDMNTSSGTTIIAGGSQSGCDSIINVDLMFQDFAEGTYMENICEGASTFVNGIEYTETDTTSEFTIPNGSINGCDSLVKIKIIFFETTMGQYSETICAGDTSMINGEEFFVGMESSSQLLINQNSMGCDSMVEVTVLIDDPVSGAYTGDFCSSFSIDINGSTYDQSNPTGIESFEGQASNGCDSVVMINLTFNQQSIDSTINISTCDNDFTLSIGSEIFDISNLSGTVNVPSNSPGECDTTFFVDLLFGELGVNYVEMDDGCTVSDSGSVLIESSNGDVPFNIFYNGNNTIAFTLPIEIRLPVGSGEITIVDDNGCEIILPYVLFPGGGDDFEIIENQGQFGITGGAIDSIIWTPSNGLSCTDCIDPLALPTQTTTYTATVFYGDSCTTELSIEVIVIDDTPDYVLPSVFSPNGDNMNDNFILTITEGAMGTPQNMTIFDRWGNLVFSGFGDRLTSEGWDGAFNGNPVNSGVYVYQITVLDNGQLITIYGDVTVVR